MSWVIVILYSASLVYVFLFSIGQLHLTWHYLRSKKGIPEDCGRIEDWPLITIQLPIYNEKYVVERLLNSIVNMDYPADKLEIQLLDDSDDETTDIIAEFIKGRTLSIKHIRRNSRAGFKAGALQYGLDRAKGEFIAIFDSDFVPKEDFLRQTIPVFTKSTGVVQTRWGHINREFSLLTRLQAFGLDAHFTVEQSGRADADSFINFNGTGGVWRKECIQDAGGWSADTLTEDLDLSYRAQLMGWKFKYLEDCIAPAELPILMSAVKSQQYRWNKGAAESARKNLGKVFRSAMPLSTKIHALFHLLNSSVFVCLLIASILSIPMLFIKDANPDLSALFNLGSIFLIGFLSIGVFYWVASKNIGISNSGAYFFRTFPLFLVVSMGLSFHNGLAVLEGLVGRKTPFIRTPKFNVSMKGDSWTGNKYIKFKLTFQTVLEGLLSLYFIFGIISGVLLQDWGLMIFHVMLALGFAMVFIYSLKPIGNA